MYLLQSSYQSLPEKPGVYLFLDNKGKVLYVGKAKNLKIRVSSYFLNKSLLGEKTKVLLKKTAKVKFFIVSSEIESFLLEANYIKKYQPSYNVRLRDAKTYPFIQITIKDRYPKILVTRKTDDKKSLYFGPYPNVGALRIVLRTLRKIFPYQSVINHPKKICLFHHLGLCPCPPIFDSPQIKKNYRKNILQIIKILNGKIKNVLSDLRNERDEESKRENFEKAKELQKKIDALTLITTSFHSPFEYESNPNLLSDLRKNELLDLKNNLRKFSVTLEMPKRIECFDISNIAGYHATGSMIVFIDGEKEPSSYRKFRIKKGGTPNDTLMMNEIISRRLNHDEWDFPDLIIVDGGKGQISAALKALREKNKKIPVIGLAKREELIITSNFKEINLPDDSPSLHLLTRIRDEAHRFAISYHRKLRSKTFLY